MKTSTLSNAVQAADLNAGPSADWLLVDVRTPGEFGEAHIDGSWNTPLGGLKQQASAIKDRAAGKSIALICRTDRRAQEAHSVLEAHGLDSLHILKGGVVAWEQAGLPLLRGGGTAMSLERQVRIAAGSLVVLGMLLGYFVHPGFFGLCGFVGAGLVFAGLTDTCGMGMLLAKMPWNTTAAACPASAPASSKD